MLGYASENLNFGIGLRGGKTLDNHIYIGGTFVYQTGDSGSYSGGVTTGTTTVTTSGSWSYNGFYVGPEGGYDFDLKVVVVRPYLGLGIFDATGSASGNGTSFSGSSTQFVIWPGCTVIWNVPGSSFFLAGDVRLISVPDVALGIYAMGGLHFGS
jgi:outer membrane autotransporter protein